MISLRNLTKYYPSNRGKQFVFSDLSFDIPTDRNIALLGSNGAGKSTLFRMIAGSEYPNSGSIVTSQDISWPVALTTGIHPQMTGRENTRFIGRVNGVADLDLYEEKVKEFAELGEKYELPVKTYSSGMRSRLAFGTCIAIDFNVYLIDEATSVGDQKFRRKAKSSLLEKREKASLLMVSHDTKEIEEFCDSALILHDGKLNFYDNLSEGYEFYNSL
jgi:capsular polysaccharide transport system ATP-binding protein